MGKSVLSTWEGSFEAIENHNPAAARLRSLLAFVNFEDIFLGLFNGDDTGILASTPSRVAEPSEATTSSHVFRAIAPFRECEMDPLPLEQVQKRGNKDLEPHRVAFGDPPTPECFGQPLYPFLDPLRQAVGQRVLPQEACLDHPLGAPRRSPRRFYHGGVEGR